MKINPWIGLLIVLWCLFANPAHATDTPISQMTNGGLVQPGDMIPVARCGYSGCNYRVTIGPIAPLNIGGGLANSSGNLVIVAPTLSTLGGVYALAGPTSHQFLTYIDNAGTQHLAQPAASDISGLAAVATSGSASDLTTGIVSATLLPAFSGDFTTSPGSSVATLATVNSSPGSYGDTSHVATYTVDGKGRVTASGVATITPTSIGAVPSTGTKTVAGGTTFTGPIIITENATTLPAMQTGTLLQIGNADGTPTRLQLNSYGSASFFSGIRADGTNASPTAVQSGDELASLNAWGYNGTAVVGPQAAYREYAAQPWSVGANGTYLSLATTANGSTTLTERLRVENDGGITVPSTVTGGDKGAGTINVTNGYIQGSQIWSQSTPLAGFSSTTGTLTSGDTIFTAIEKLYGNAQALVVNLANQVTGLLAVVNGGSGQSLFPEATKHKPIVGVIGHSYAGNFTLANNVATASATGGVVTITTDYALSATNGWTVKLQGCGAPFDIETAKLTSVTNNTNGSTYTYAITDTGTYSTVHFGVTTGVYCTLYLTGGNSTFSGMNSLNYVDLANSWMGDVFDMPRSYILFSYGGDIQPTYADDPGFVNQALRMAAKNPLPSVVVVDYGVNACGGVATIASLMATVQQGVAILNTFTHDVIFVAPRPDGLGTLTLNQRCSALTNALETGAAQGKWYVMDSRQRLSDISSTTGAMLSQYTTDSVHLNGNGAVQDAYQFMQEFSWMFPNAFVSYASQTDPYNVTNNPQGDIGPGLMKTTASSISVTSTPTAIGNYKVTLLGAGTGGANAIIQGRTDTFPEGTVVPGYELVISFPSGTGDRHVQVQEGNGSLTAAGPGHSGTVYPAGAGLFARMSWSLDATSLANLAGFQFYEPGCAMQEVGATTNQWAAALNDAGDVSNWFATSGVVTTNWITAQAGTISTYVATSCSVGISGANSGTVSVHIKYIGTYMNNGYQPRVF